MAADPQWQPLGHTRLERLSRQSSQAHRRRRLGALDAITKEELQQELLTTCSTQTCTVLMITHAIDDGLSIDDFPRSCNRFAHDADAAA